MKARAPRSSKAVLTALLAAGLAVSLAGQQRGSSDELIDRTSRYIEAYEKAFAAVVSEERQVQTLTGADGRVKKTRELRGDFLLIKTGPEWALVFRDIITVDGKAVRNRDERLRRLFIEHPKTALAQAEAIATESRRYNIGISRQGNSPLLPLLFLHPRTRDRSRLTVSGDRITFEEFVEPTIMGIRRGGNRTNLPAKGVLAADPASGRVVTGGLIGIGPAKVPSISLSVVYAEEPLLKLMVPISVHERYWFEQDPKADRLDVEASYSNFRRFQVTTGEEIKLPKQ